MYTFKNRLQCEIENLITANRNPNGNFLFSMNMDRNQNRYFAKVQVSQIHVLCKTYRSGRGILHSIFILV